MLRRKKRRGIKTSARISGCIVVADAMNCRIETAKAILEANADYLLCAKSNQPTLKADIREDYFRAQNKTIQKNMNMSRKLALNLAGVYKNKHSKKTPMSHIMFDCLMDPQHLLTVLGKN